MKKIPILLLSLLICLGISACSTNQAYNFKSDQGIEAFIQKLESENQKIKALNLEVDGYFNIFGSELRTNIKNTGKYTGPSQLDMLYRKVHSETPESKSEVESMIKVSEFAYEKKAPEAEWKEVDLATADQTKNTLEYFSLLDLIVDIIKNDTYEVKETDTDYEFIISNKNFDFVEKFKGHLNFTFENFDQNLINKNIVFVIDKNSFFLKKILVDLDYEIPVDLDYDQDRNVVNVKANILMSNFNAVDESLFDLYKN